MKTKFAMMTVAILVAALVTNGQAPQGFNYQAAVRHSSGAVFANQLVGLQFSVIDSSAAGTVVYVETDTATTNEYGLFTVVVGSGTATTGTFTGIKWGVNAKYLQVAIDTTGGTNYTVMGTSELQSVPYALSSAQWYSSGNDIYNLNTNTVHVTGMHANTSLRIDNAGKYDYAEFYNDNASVYRGYIGIYNDTTGLDVGTGGGNTIGTFNLVTDAIPRVTITPQAQVGINNTSPTFALDVTAINGSNDVLNLNANAQNPLITVQQAGVPKFYLQSYNGGVYLYNYEDSDISFGVSTSTEILHLAASSKSVGIGTSTPATTLDVQGDVTVGTTASGTNINLRASGITGNIEEFSVGMQLTAATGNGATGCYFYMNSSGNAYEPGYDNKTAIGTSSFRYSTVYAANGVLETSDARLKKNVQNLDMGLKEVMALRPVSYEWVKPSDGQRERIGFIAQEVENIVPQAVQHDYVTDKQIEVIKARHAEVPEMRDIYGMNYSEMIPVLTKAIQEQQAMIEKLEKKVEQLESAK